MPHRGIIEASLLFLAMLATAANAAQGRLLEIWVNGHNSRVVARVSVVDGIPTIAASDLAKAGVSAFGPSEIALDGNTAIRAETDEIGQRLLLAVDPRYLSVRSFDLRPSIVEDVTPAGRGATLSYDISASSDDVSRARAAGRAGGAFGLTLFDSNARLTATGFVDSRQQTHGARLDTSLEFDYPKGPRKLVFGDSITGGFDWTRPIRFGGIQIASDFSQQPGRITFPLPEYFGVASVPSTVDVFVGASRVFETQIDQGPFSLGNLPILTGGGAATVVVRDILGRETRQAISLYADPVLLTPGLTAYSFDAGFARREYGRLNADYGDPFASLTLQHGFGNFTAQGHGELSSALAMLGGGVAFGLGGFGLVAANGAISEKGGKTGVLGSITLDARAGDVSLFGMASAASGSFADMASLDGPTYPTLRYQAGGNSNFGRYGSLSLSLIGEQPPEGRFSRLVNGSYSLTVGSGVYLGVTGFYNMTDRSSAAEIFLSVPLNAGIATASASAGSGSASLRAAFDKPASPDGGVGYRLSLGTQTFNRAEAGATWVADDGVVSADAGISSGKLALRGDIAGGFVLMDNNLYATRGPDGALALVDAGAPNVKIYRENRLVGVSDGDGKILLTGLAPYTANRIGVEPRDYPMDTTIANPERIVVPPRGAVVEVPIAPAGRQSFVATIRLENGAPPPIGASVYVAGHDEAAIVGRGGEVFFANFGPPAEALIRAGALACQVRIDPPRGDPSTVPRIGPLTCYRNVANAR